MKKGTLVRVSFLDHAVAPSKTDGKPIQGVAVGFLREESDVHLVLCSMILGDLDNEDSNELIIVKTPGMKIKKVGV